MFSVGSTRGGRKRRGPRRP